jgi:hypothetical protein
MMRETLTGTEDRCPMSAANSSNELLAATGAAESVNSIGLPQSPDTAKSSAKPVVYACSGCSDAGELADRIA